MSTKFEKQEVKNLGEGNFEITIKEITESVKTERYNSEEMSQRIESIQRSIDATVYAKNRDIARHNAAIDRLIAQKTEIEKILADISKG